MKLVQPRRKDMPVTVVVGAQFGDEGKGKVVDKLAENAKAVVRYGGGANAGHTMHVGEKKVVTHLLPSGLLQNKVCVLGAGMVIDPEQLLKEMDHFRNMVIDVSPGQIMISTLAHIVLPGHMALDGAYESARGGKAIGTTGRGIGPAYKNKASRNGLRAGMMKSPLKFGQRVRELTKEHNIELAMLGRPQLNPDHVASKYEEYANRLADYVRDTSSYLRQCLNDGQTILAEGAQGVLLDVDYGSYPYVTSSSTLAAPAAPGCGVGPKDIDRIIGVAKCFLTRVGSGKLVTEIFGDEILTKHLRGKEGEAGYEAGATTGRLRRIGWLDLPLLRYAVAVCGIEELVLTKLDVLSGLSMLKICTAYRHHGNTYTDLPENWTENVDEFIPEYAYLPGWPADSVQGVRSFDKLPDSARLYVKMIEDAVGPKTKVSMISVGADRDDIIIRQK